MRSLGSTSSRANPSGRAAAGLAVENARKMSPEPLPATLPVRANPRAARLARRERVLLVDVEPVRVVQVAFVGLGDDGQQPRRLLAAGAGVVLDDRVADGADAGGVGQHDRPLQEARLLDPGGAGHLAIA